MVFDVKGDVLNLKLNEVCNLFILTVYKQKNAYLNITLLTFKLTTIKPNRTIFTN